MHENSYFMYRWESGFEFSGIFSHGTVIFRIILEKYVPEYTNIFSTDLVPSVPTVIATKIIPTPNDS